jgi:NADH:ubiquinone oxidoreductase subunit 2 (subunit N)
VLKRIYIVDPPGDAGPIAVPVTSVFVLCAIAFGVVLLGCAPNILLAWLTRNSQH